ncbi:MAG: hypothetical protein GF317_11140 [Candidatus Lokiarchaeota archaeon]|nr:hypothetical protein [Candidatus Lokiarchaeota archaeon]
MNEELKMRVLHFNLIQEVIDENLWTIGEKISLIGQLVKIRKNFIEENLPY